MAISQRLEEVWLKEITTTFFVKEVSSKKIYNSKIIGIKAVG